MRASAWYGLVLAILCFVLDRLNSPLAWATYWAIQATSLAACTAVIWQRTHLLLVAVTTADAALVSAAMVPTSVAGYTLANLPAPWMTLFWIDTAALVAVHLLCWVVYREQFRRWKEFMEPLSLRDFLLFRDIPRLE